MRDVDTLLQTIQNVYPRLAIENVHLNQNGQYNDVLIVNGALVFRFAKFAEGIATLRHELAILTSIRNDITLAIPDPLYWHVETETAGEAFIGYPILPGRPLWLEDYQAIHDPEALAYMAQQLAEFMRELHSIPVAQAVPIALPTADTLEEWTDLYHRIQHHLFPHMRPAARRQVGHHFEDYLANPRRYQFDPVLRHGDFGTGNLLYDPATLTITGVIDFGATALGDPAIDFAGLFAFGDDFCRQCIEFYPSLGQMLDRVHFYQGTFALQEALYGIETGDMEAFASGMEEYS
jgi:aminoglycoside 2''-phosphotransferase